MSKSQNPWARSRNTKQNRKWMTFVLFLPSCPNAGEQKYWKKSIGNEWFWYYSCLRALVQESRNTEKNNTNWMISYFSWTPQDDISWLPASCPGGGHQIFYCKYWCLSSRPVVSSRRDASKRHQVPIFSDQKKSILPPDSRGGANPSMRIIYALREYVYIYYPKRYGMNVPILVYHCWTKFTQNRFMLWPKAP